MLKKICMLLLTAALLTACTTSQPDTEVETPLETQTEAATEATAEPLAEQTVQNPTYATAVMAHRDMDLDMSDGSALHAVSDDQGARIISLLRLPLPAAVRGSQLEQAWLDMYRKEGDEPNVRIGVVEKSWVMQEMTWDFATDSVDFENAVQEGEDLGDGWYRYDVTEQVRRWLQGEGNYGFAIEALEKNRSIVFASPFDEDITLTPKLTVRYREDGEGRAYGKYDFAAQSEGNCLSYALRDKSSIFLDALVSDEAAFEAAVEAGEGLAYFSGLVLDYVETHQDKLGVTSIRVVSGEDAEIDADKEYLVALRVGFHNRNGVEGIQAMDGDFDYHLRVRLRNGSWAEKFPQDESRVTPGSNADNSLNQFPWDASYMPGYEKWHEYYDSEPVYYVVSKSTDAFTAHMEE